MVGYIINPKLKPGFIFHLVLGGKERHQVATAMAAIISAMKGYKIENMTNWATVDMRPDLVIKKQDRIVEGPRRDNKVFTYWIEIIDHHDPEPDWKAKGNVFDDIWKIRITDCKTFDEIWNLIWEKII